MGLFGLATKKEKKQLQDEIEKRDVTIKEYQQKLEDVEASLNRIKVSSGMKDLPENEQIEQYQKIIVDRDAEISNLQAKLADATRELDEQLSTHAKMMEAVLNEKDKQIKKLDTNDNLRKAVAAEALGKGKQSVWTFKKVEKSEEQQRLIKDALLANSFMRGLSENQLERLIDAMASTSYPANEKIIKENSNGDEMYIIQDGEVSVSKDGTHITDIKRGLFGELAIMYNCQRTATVTSKTPVTLWKLHRGAFQLVVKSAGEEKLEEKYQLLKSQKDLSGLKESNLRKIADCLEEEHYEDGDIIIKQGEVGDNFFIIRTGSVRITVNDGEGEKEVAQKAEGEFFGEKALLTSDTRSANVYAVGDIVCYTLDRNSFTNLIGSLDAPESTVDLHQKAAPTRVVPEEILGCKDVKDLTVVKNLGAGGFGLVKLVTVKGIDNRAFALKCIQKCRVVEYGQESHVMDEKNILAEMQSPFILGLLRTFKDKKFVYILTDAYLGGDLWRTLCNKGPFKDSVARFYAACVVQAFEYLHSRDYCYRDLKPENLMVDEKGYVRLVDLGFAKKVLPGHKTWTFCGTPEYIPPEIITNSGHNVCADLWSLGILIFELCSRKTPFFSNNDMDIYEKILQGIHAVSIPFRVSRKAESLIKQLCKREPSERIGYQKDGFEDIRRHRWYAGFDWEALQNETMIAPHPPKISSFKDCSNFDSFKAESESKVPEENSGWDADF
ncbi:Oidioi.mRNA.OKI2018_I69.chr2.g4012.t2.cds [Oikopleura dioica]|uniref:cGMP-dependent protein kinase n=1 Tax=Oikopleura dioica TaxID=34765 RepID=A0ABN7T075_OIKDI|nr:Oidioi.mRNA.OKI2018_I69.chr2.g4012.t2.cds [Oikopleura dioica]